MTWNHFHFHLQAPKCRLMAKHARRGNASCRPASTNLLCSIYIIYGTATALPNYVPAIAAWQRERERQREGSMLWNWQPAFYGWILFCHAFLSEYENYDCILEYYSRCPFALLYLARIVYALLSVSAFGVLQMSGLYWGRLRFGALANYEVE